MKALFTVLPALVLFIAAAAAQPPPAGLEEQPASFCINPATTYQKIEGFGAGFFWQTLEAASDLTPEERERMYDLLYTNKGLRLNILRLAIPGNQEPLPQHDPLRSRGLKYNWSKEAYIRQFYESLSPVFARVRPVVYAVPYTPPARWKADKAPNWGGALLPQHYHDYADYLADFLKYSRLEHKVNIDVLSLQNEPDVAAPYASARWTGEELRDFLKVLGATLRAEGLSTKLMVSEGSTWDQTAIEVAPILQDPEARKYVGILASHSYGWDDLVDRGRRFMQSATARHGLPLWMSEMSILDRPEDPSIRTAMKVAHYMYRDFVEAGVSAWIYCLAIARIDPIMPGSLGILAPPKNGALVIPKRFWAFANYSRFVQPGWKRMQVEGLAFANAGFVGPQGDRFALVALNNAFRPRGASYDFGAWDPIDVETFRTSKDSDLASVPGTQIEGNTLRATLAPASITTFVGCLKQAARPPRPCVALEESDGPAAKR